MARTEVRTIFHDFRDDMVMAVSQAFPWGVAPHLPKTQSRRAHVFGLFFSDGRKRAKFAQVLKTIRCVHKFEIRILVFVEVIIVKRYIRLDFSLFNDVKILFVRISKVKEEQPHQDECDERDIFSEEVSHGDVDVLLNNGKKTGLLFGREKKRVIASALI